ncbi:MAG: cytochrome c [Bryobacteraceae bacterium]
MLLLCAVAAAHEPITTKLTWTKEISRIVYKRCASCHREGGASPMSLLHYDDARPWAKAIRDEVLERRMPPWGAVRGFGEFRGDKSLLQPEIDMLVNWVEGGAPKGDDVFLPSLPSPGPPPSEPNAKRAGLRMSASMALQREIAATGIEPFGPMQVSAILPDGAVRNLIWLREYKVKRRRPYYFRKPVRLPKGTRIQMHGAKGAAVLILTGKPGL